MITHEYTLSMTLSRLPALRLSPLDCLSTCLEARGRAAATGREGHGHCHSLRSHPICRHAARALAVSALGLSMQHEDGPDLRYHRVRHRLSFGGVGTPATNPRRFCSRASDCSWTRLEALAPSRKPNLPRSSFAINSLRGDHRSMRKQSKASGEEFIARARVLRNGTRRTRPSDT